MAITITRAIGSAGLVDAESDEWVYIITGTADQGEALAALKAEAPALSNNLYRGQCVVEEIYIDSENPADCRWRGRAPYAPFDGGENKPKEAIALDAIVIRGTTGGGTHHITSSLGTIATAVRAIGDGGNGKVPKTDNGIAWNGEEFEGIDIGVEQFDFTVTKVFTDPTDCNLSTIYALGWTVNNAEVSYTDTETGITITLAAGECLFKWMDFGRARGDDGLEVTYHMAASPNKAAGWRTFGPIEAPAKKGWEICWEYRTATEDAYSKRLTWQVQAVFVDKVYELGDHSGLAI